MLSVAKPHWGYHVVGSKTRGGCHASRTGVEDCIGIGGIAVFGSRLSLMMMVKQDPALAMMMSLYATLGVFLLLAARNPSEHRSLIAFTAWSSFAHAALMAVQAFLNLIPRRELLGVVVLILIGVVLIASAPAKQPVEQPSTVVA
jgi:predicted membrane channel-forming protein YqfA (hemolysin III family)